MTSWSQTVCAWLTALVFVVGTLSAVERSSPPVPTLASTTARTLDLGEIETAAAGLSATAPVEATEVPVTTISSSTTTTQPRSIGPSPTRLRPPVAAAPAPPAPAPSPSPAPSEAERCDAARQWVGERGLVVPRGWDYRCPDEARDERGGEHWGIACWNCEGGSHVGINVRLIGPSDANLRYVVAHEICHAIDYVTLGISTELTADLCATLHGAGRP
jgi:hypothetical protein